MQALRGAVSPVPLVGLLAGALLLTAGLAAGVWAWPTAWIFLAIFCVASSLGSGLLAALRPASFQVRQQGWVQAPEKKQPLIDALGLWVYAGFMLGWFACIPLDVFRWRLLPPPSTLLQGLGLAAVIAGLGVVHLAIAQNRFAAPTIHDQSAEHQQVIQTGLYGVVRHPFYAGMLLVYTGAATWLGSFAAAIASCGFLIMTLARIRIEERFLRERLPDYADYARRVRSRLIPFVL